MWVIWVNSNLIKIIIIKYALREFLIFFCRIYNGISWLDINDHTNKFCTGFELAFLFLVEERKHTLTTCSQRPLLYSNKEKYVDTWSNDVNTIQKNTNELLKFE